MRRWMPWMAAWLATWLGLQAQTLTTLEYRVSGSALDVSPAVLTVPKGIAGSVTTRYAGDPSLLNGAYVVATLRGGGAPSRELLGAPGQPLMLPALNVSGDYQLDGIQLVRDEGTRRVVVMEASPRSVPVRVFDEVLVTRVTSRPLTTDEIREKGIFLDDTSFRVTEFEVGLVLDGKTIPIKAPVVSPRAAQSTELVPRAEVEQRLAQAEALNQQIAEQIVLPKEVQVAGIQVKGIAFQFTEDTDAKVGLSIPPIPALLVIPGNIGFLNQFFSVQVFTENAAPAGSGLSVFNVQARLVLPPGTDRMTGTGDDPLRFARVGASAEVRSQLPVRGVGPDGKAGTDDDVARLKPGEGGTCEFLVEGLREGLHVLDLELSADLEGLAAGLVRVTGTAAGSVLVRNPRFSLAFSSPRTVRAQEPYWASVTILNTSETPANEVSVTLPTAAVSGAELLGEPTVRLGTILPGQSATARYRLKSLRTGRVRFSNLSFGDEVTSGQFRLSMGVDERGVELSPDSLAMPDDALRLPEALLAAADRVLGQALSAVTAPLVPRGVVRPARPILRTRILELTEAGQRLRLGDDPGRVYADLLLDWQGGREFDAGLDQILGETEAGRQWREAVALELGRSLEAGPGVGTGAPALLGRMAADLAGRGEAWVVVADDALGAVVELGTPASEVPRAMSYGGPQGRWTVYPGGGDPRMRWRLAEGVPSMRVARLDLGTNGVGRLGEMALGAQPAGGCVGLMGTTLSADAECDGTPEAEVAGAGMEVRELPPRVIRVVQDPSVVAGRPDRLCLPPMDVFNYGTVVAVLFSKPMSSGLGAQASLFALDDGNGAQSVQIQPGGRMALVNLRRGVSAIRPRRLWVGEVADVRGNRMTPSTSGIVHRLGDGEWKAGVALNGRVLRADGMPAAGVPVTLTMEDEVVSFDECIPYIFRVSQVVTDARGEFTFDFVLAGPRYAVSATDTTGLSGDAVAALVGTDDSGEARRVLTELAERNPGTLLAAFAVGSLPEAVALVEGLDRAVVRDQVATVTRHGTTNVVGLQFRGRGTVLGTVYQPGTTHPAPNVAVNLFPDPGSRERGRGLMTDGSGRFAFFGVPLGVFTVEVDDGLGHATTVDGVLSKPGEVAGLGIPLLDVPVRFGGVTGRVTEPDQATPAAGATVYVGEVQNRRVGRIVASTIAGADGSFAVSRVPEGTWAVVAFSSDGSRVGIREGIRVSDGVATTVSVDLEGFGRLTGRVLTPGGVPVARALVSGGIRLATTDEEGRFEISDIPLGRRTVSAAVTPELNPAVRVARRGSRTVEVLPGTLNVSDIVLEPAGVVKGTVRDQDGKPVPRVRVAKPVEGGFLHVMADDRGFYRFEGLAPGEHVFSAPSPPVADTDVSGILDVLSSSSSEEALQGAIMDAFAIFTGMRDPLLNGQGAAFSPSDWGYNTGRIDADDQEVTVDITYMRRGSVGGLVRNGQGVLIGARVQVASIAPANNGLPMLRVSGEMDSDAAAGTWAFEDTVRLGGGAIRPSSVLPVPGTFRLFCASPFFPVVLEQGGQLSEVRPAIRDVEFRFPPPRETQGRIAGRVFNPDGTGAADGVRVLVPYEGALGVTEAMQSRGFREEDVRNAVTQEVGADLGPAGKAVAPEFPSTALLPAPRSYEVFAVDPVSGFVGRSTVWVEPGVTSRVDVRLLGPGALVVRVTDAAGVALAGADVRVQAMGFPHGRFTGVTDALGQLRLEGVIEGRYEAFATAVVGASRVEGRAVADAARGVTTALEVRLAASGTVAGTYLRRDGTPVGGAQVRVNGFLASTDATGAYRVTGVPLGPYLVRSEDPVTGLGVEASGQLSAHGDTLRIDLREPFLGEVVGTVLDGFRTGVVPGAPVTLVHGSGLHPVRRAAADAAGRYRFGGVPAGAFRVEASDPRTGLRGEGHGTVGESAPLATVNVLMEPRVNVRVTVLDALGRPASASVLVSVGTARFEGDTASDGVAVFGNLPTGLYRVIARSREGAGSRDVGSATLAAPQPGEASALVRLRGVGETTGRVVLGDGVTPVPAGTEVQLTGLAPELASLNDPVQTVFTDALGAFRFGNVASGDNRLLVRMGGLSATATYLQPAGAVASQDLVLTPAGTVAGRVLRENGVPAALVQATLFFGSRGGLADRVSAATGVDGRFELADVPLGTDMALRLSAEGFDGLRDTRVTLATNGQRADLGDLVLDESAPRLVATEPANDASGVSTRATLVLDFSEALDAASVDDGGIRLIETTTGAAIPFTASLERAPDGVARRVRVAPSRPLRSETRHGLLVLPAVPNAGGGMDTGPRDLAGRLVDRTSSITFLTADNDPPRLVSIFPADGEVHVNIGTLTNALTPRVAFSEPVRDGVTMLLAGPDGAVTGRTEVSAGGLVARFLTERLLRSNTRYTLVVSNVLDLAGNEALGQPFFSTFDSVDDIGPELSVLRLRDGVAPVAGRRVELEALLAQPEEGARVRFLSGLTNLLGIATAAPHRLAVQLPGEGSVVFSAIAQDRFGNDGSARRLVLETVPDQPPDVALALVEPASAPVTRGQPFRVRATATDDVGVASLRLVAFAPLVLDETVEGGSLERTFTVPNSAPVTGTAEWVVIATDTSGRRATNVLAIAWRKVNQAPTARPEVALVEPGRLRVTLGGTDPDDDPLTAEVMALGEGIHVFQTADGITPADEITAPGTRVTDGQGRVLVQVAARFAGTARVQFRVSDGEASSPVVWAESPLRGSAWKEVAGVFDTGVDDARRPLADGATDPHYRLVANADGPGTDAVVHGSTIFPIATGPWLANSTRSKWIAPRVDTAGAAAGRYQYELAFVIDDVIAETAVLEGAWAMDDAADGIRVNGGLVAVSSSGMGALARFEVPQALAAGTNRLVFGVVNGGGQTGLRVEGLRVLGLRRDVFAGKDADADGIDDAVELANGLEPEDPTDAALDRDADGLSNRDELVAGTRLDRADTDADGLADGVEVASGCLDPLRADTDGDGSLDGVDQDPCNVGRPPVVLAPESVEVVAGTPMEWVIRGVDADGNLARLEVTEEAAATRRLDFSGPGEGQVSGTASIREGVLELTAASGGQLGGFLMPTDGTVAMASYRVAFDLFIGSGSGADGFSFCHGPDLAMPFGEQGTGPGLRVQLDTFPNGFLEGFDDEANTIEVWHANTRLAKAGGIGLRTHRFVPVEITVVDGRVTVRHDGVVVVDAVELPGWSPQPGWMMAMGARTGGATDRHWVDNLEYTSVLGLAMQWAGLGGRRLDLQPLDDEREATLSVLGEREGTTRVTVTATDADGLRGSASTMVTVLPDLDGDGMADRDDADMDGDGLANADEALRGTSPRARDTDGDTLLDGAEVVAGTDPLRTDTDDDTVPDGVDPFPTAANRAPEPGEDRVATNPGETVRIALVALLANDSDPEGDRVEFVGFSQPAAGGTVTRGVLDELVFQPGPGVADVEVAFEYVVADAWGRRASGTVRVTVRENTRPVAGNVLPYESGGLTLDGIDDGVSGPLLAGIADNFALEFWARPERARGAAVEQAAGTSGQFVGELAVFPAHGDGLGGGLHAGAGVSVGLNGVVVVEHAANYFPTPLVHDAPLSGWTHVAVVYEDRRPTLYLNGEPVRVGLRSGRVVHPSASLSIALGRYRGQMDEFRVWDHARTPAQVREGHSRRVARGERGLALLWRMDEATGSSLVDGSGQGRDGTLTGGTGRVTPAAPLTARGVRETAFVGEARALHLPGADAEGQPLVARIDVLPAHGRLFQFASGAAGTEIASAGTLVADSSHRVVYVPADGFAGDDSFGFSLSDGLLDSAVAEALLTVGEALAARTDDVWDVGRGAVVMATSGMHPQSAAANLFGGLEGGVEAGNALFRDGAPAGTVHAVEWQTPGTVAVRGFDVYLADDQPASANRGISALRIYGRLDEQGSHQLLATYPVASNPYFGGQRFRARVQFPEFVGRFFRAEFDQVADGPAGGPRVEELDAIGEGVAWVPSFGDIVLRNATSDGAQGGFPPSEMIDGIIEGGGTQNGWAGDIGGTPSLAAVFETDADLPSTASTEFLFRVVQPYGGGHALGCFRLSATTDPRDAFADGLASGGDVSATWTVLRVVRVTSDGGETFQVRPDQSVLVTGNQPGATTYIVRARGIAGRVTGFRLEALEDPALSNNGPGRTGHGNWVVNEFTAAWQGGPLVVNRAPRGVADAVELFQGEPVVVRPLSNDTDPEGDALSLSTVTGPDPVAGGVHVRDDGSLLFEPASSFLGVATLRYRPADAHQQGDEVEVRMEVRARPPLITSAGSATGRVGEPFVYPTVTARFPTGFAATGLPPGVVLDAATGRLAGVPSQAGEFRVTLVATNTAGAAQLDLAVSIAAPAIVLLDTLGPVNAFDPQPFGTGSLGAAFSGMSASDPSATGDRAAVAFTVPAESDVSLDGVSMALSQAFGPVNARVSILASEPSFGPDGGARDVPGVVVAVLAENPVLATGAAVRSLVPASPVVLRAGNRYWLMLEPSVTAGFGSTRWHGAVGAAGRGTVAMGSWNTLGRSFDLFVNADVGLPAVRLAGSAVASVPNGDFELPVLASGGAVTLASLGGSLGGWSAVGSDAERVSIVAAGGGSSAATPDLRTPRRGRQALVSRDGADFTLVMGNLEPGATYRLVYASKQVRVGGRFTSLPGGSVLADGVPIVTLFETGPSASDYATLEAKQCGSLVTSAYFTAKAGSVRIDFRPDDIPTAVDHYCIDDVRLERVEALGARDWKRQEQWVEGTSPFTSVGNPAPDGRGNAVWAYEWMDNMRDGTLPFYAARRIPMVWDPAWGGAVPLWASGNDTVPMALRQGTLAFNWRQAPVVGWIKPPSDAQAVAVRGHVRLSWYAVDGVPFPHSVLLALVKVAANGTTTELLSRTVAPGDGTFPGEVLVPVSFPSVPMQTGDRICLMSLLDIPASGPTFSAVLMVDDLVFSEVGNAGGGGLGVPWVSLAEAPAPLASPGRVASKASEDPGRVTPWLAVDRAMPGPLRVRYRVVRGTDAGLDWEGDVPAGGVSVALPELIPARSGGLAPAEVVRVRLMEGPGYALGAESEKTYVLAGSAFAHWQASRYTAGALLAGLGEAGADPDGDGESNLLEFAMGDDGRLRVGWDGGTPVFEHVRRAGGRTMPDGSLEVDGLRYVLEASDDLRAWAPAAGRVATVGVSPAGVPGYERVTLRLGSAGGFLRVRVEGRP